MAYIKEEEVLEVHLGYFFQVRPPLNVLLEGGEKVHDYVHGEHDVEYELPHLCFLVYRVSMVVQWWDGDLCQRCV